MKLTISAQDKPAQKDFNYQLEFNSDTVLKVMGFICATIVTVSLLSLFKKK